MTRFADELRRGEHAVPAETITDLRGNAMSIKSTGHIHHPTRLGEEVPKRDRSSIRLVPVHPKFFHKGYPMYKTPPSNIGKAPPDFLQGRPKPPPGFLQGRPPAKADPPWQRLDSPPAKAPPAEWLATYGTDFC